MRLSLETVLQSKGHPVPYFSRKLARRHLNPAASEREWIGLAKAISYWRSYLWRRKFLIKTDHYSLKFQLEQRMFTSPQQHSTSELLGFDFHVHYVLKNLILQ